MKLRLLPLFIASLFASCAFAQEAAFTNRATDLKERAAADARTVAPLPEGASIKVLERAGGWTRVEAEGRQGWVRVFHLRFPTTATTESSGGGLLTGISSAISGRSRTQQAGIQTVGVRGLSPEELKNASPDTEALRRMQSYRAETPAAERFAREGRLTEAQVDYNEGGRR